MNRTIYTIALTCALIGTLAGNLPVSAMMNRNGDGGGRDPAPTLPARTTTKPATPACHTETVTTPNPVGPPLVRRIYVCR